MNQTKRDKDYIKFNSVDYSLTINQKHVPKTQANCEIKHNNLFKNSEKNNFQSLLKNYSNFIIHHQEKLKILQNRQTAQKNSQNLTRRKSSAKQFSENLQNLIENQPLETCSQQANLDKKLPLKEINRLPLIETPLKLNEFKMSLTPEKGLKKSHGEEYENHIINSARDNGLTIKRSSKYGVFIRKLDFQTSGQQNQENFLKQRKFLNSTLCQFPDTQRYFSKQDSSLLSTVSKRNCNLSAENSLNTLDEIDNNNNMFSSQDNQFQICDIDVVEKLKTMNHQPQFNPKATISMNNTFVKIQLRDDALKLIETYKNQKNQILNNILKMKDFDSMAIQPNKVTLSREKQIEAPKSRTPIPSSYSTPKSSSQMKLEQRIKNLMDSSINEKFNEINDIVKEMHTYNQIVKQKQIQQDRNNNLGAGFGENGQAQFKVTFNV